MEERAARGDETGAGAATVEDVTGDARGPAPGKLLNWLLIIFILEFKKHRRVQSNQIIFIFISFIPILLLHTTIILCTASVTLRKIKYALHEWL